jgi:hypothetical protein
MTEQPTEQWVQKFFRVVTVAPRGWWARSTPPLGEHWVGHVDVPFVQTLPEPTRTIVFRGLVLAAAGGPGLNDHPGCAGHENPSANCLMLMEEQSKRRHRFFAFDPGCVRTCTSQECAELFSLSSSLIVVASTFGFQVCETATEFLHAD